MKRKLLALDLALMALIAFTGWQLRAQWEAAKARERAVFERKVTAYPPPPWSPLPPVLSVPATSYADIAQKMLFSKDRNPTVVVEPPPPPPPPKPMPSLPAFYGVMNLGDGPTAVMSQKSGEPHRGVRPGDTVGEFKLLAVNDQEIALEWEGKVVVKKLEELVDRQAQSVAVPTEQTTRTPAPAQQPTGQPAPGVSIGASLRACQPGDTSPAGTVAEGFRKVLTPSPFGTICRWEQVR